LTNTTVILGGGFGGLAVANELKRLMPADHRIVVVDRSPRFFVGAAKTWIMLGDEHPDDVTHPRQALERRGIEFHQADIATIRPKEREVVTSRGTIRADHLVIALGADTNMAAIPGLAETAHTFYTLDGAMKAREAIPKFQGGNFLLLIPRTPFKCPPGPYEGILMIADYFVRRRIRDRVNLALITVEGAPMATAGPNMTTFVKEQMDRAGIRYELQRRTTSVDPDRRLVHFEAGDPVPFDFLLAIPPHVAPEPVRQAGLVNDSGWIPVDPETCEVAGFDHVYAIGDVTVVPLPGRFRPDVPLFMPKAGTAAEAQGIVVAQNIALKSAGRTARRRFDGSAYCYLETGDMHAIRGDGQFFAMPNPVMRSDPPDMIQFEGKKEWAREVARRNLG
jgi:sulfide:quinone oxidoreductase